jgi:hypothetical protein
MINGSGILLYNVRSKVSTPGISQLKKRTSQVYNHKNSPNFSISNDFLQNVKVSKR